jgi:hypothetical protein
VPRGGQVTKTEGERTPLKEYLAYPRDPTETPEDWPDVELQRDADFPILSDTELWSACARGRDRVEAQKRSPTMNSIRFSERWDKLKDSRFTTLRSYRPNREAFYRSRVGKPFRVLFSRGYWSLDEEELGRATLRSVSVVVPHAMPVSQLVRDVECEGKPDQQWLGRLLAMNRALLLEFDSIEYPFSQDGRPAVVDPNVASIR